MAGLKLIGVYLVFAGFVGFIGGANALVGSIVCLRNPPEIRTDSGLDVLPNDLLYKHQIESSVYKLQSRRAFAFAAGSELLSLFKMVFGLYCLLGGKVIVRLAKVESCTSSEPIRSKAMGLE